MTGPRLELIEGGLSKQHPAGERPDLFAALKLASPPRRAVVGLDGRATQTPAPIPTWVWAAGAAFIAGMLAVCIPAIVVAALHG